jgi:hypothetical protein
VRGGGEAAFLALAWQKGQDPYCIYNGLNAEYRPLSFRHPCPACFVVRRVATSECEVCAGKEFVEIPLEEPGEAMPPPHPRRLRNFTYGIAQALDEREAQMRGAGS